jgi:hypothetical protein
MVVMSSTGVCFNNWILAKARQKHPTGVKEGDTEWEGCIK